MKKHLLLPLLLSLSLLAGCGQTPPAPSSSSPSPAAAASSPPIQLESLSIELSRIAMDAAATQSAMNALRDSLKAALADNGVEVGAVSVTAGTSYAATAQALNEGTVDLAVLPGTAFAQLGRDAVPLLTGHVEGISPDSGSAADWVDTETQWSDASFGGSRALIVAGPSEYGRQLAARAASGTALTWEELNRARWIAPPTGGEMASVWLADHYEGNTLSDLSQLDTDTPAGYADNGRALMAALAAETADIAVISPARRLDMADIWTAELGRPDSIWVETTVLGVSEKAYDTILAARPGDETLASESFQTALAAALAQLNHRHGEIGLATGGVLSVPVTSRDLDGMRRLATIGG